MATTAIHVGLPVRLGIARARTVAAGHEAAGDVVASELPRSRVFTPAVGAYRRHRRDAGSQCQSCGTTKCRSRRHTASITEAAGENPMRIDLPGPCVNRATAPRGVHRSQGNPRRPAATAPVSRGRTTNRPGVPPLTRPANMGHVAEGHGMRTPVIDPSWHLDSFPLHGLLYCACGQPFCPSGWSGCRRAYLSVCGCRLRPIDADTIERRLQREAERVDTSSAAPAAAAQLDPETYQELFARVEVGGTVDDIRIVRRA